MRLPVDGTTNHILQDRWDREQSQPFLMASHGVECEGGKPGLESLCVVAGRGEGKGREGKNKPI